MGQKRKQPARGGGGSAAKKRISEAASHSQPPAAETPPGSKKSTPARTGQSEPREVELPTKVKDRQPLPTVPAKPQPLGLPLQDYQSYSESGVIAAALQRSRTKWLQDSVFEKYWVKPSKRKSQPQPTFQNPPRESMVKLGPCTIVIEPHHFDAVLYAVRDPRSNAPPQPTTQGQRPIVQYTLPANPDNFHQFQPHPPPNQGRASSQHAPSNPSAPPQTPPQQPQQPQQPPQPQQPQQLPQPPHPQQPQQPQQAQHSQKPQQPQQPPQPPQTQQRHEPPNQTSTPNPPQQGPPQQQQKQPAPTTTAAPTQPAQAPSDPTPQAAKPSPDPVIQMLATRAASNPELKALMRVVASSEASQEQLLAFQAHIDELNAILASRQKDQPPSSNAPASQRHGPPGQGSGAPTTGPVVGKNAPQPAHQGPPMYPRPPQSTAPQPIRSKGVQKGPAPHPPYMQQQQQQRPPPPPKQEVKAVVLEFVPPAGSTAAAHGASGDRYLFPANTILDYFPGNLAVMASFLVTKKVDLSAPHADLATNQATTKQRSKKSKKPADSTAPIPADGSPSETPSQTPAPKQEEPENQLATAKQENSNIKEFYQPVTMCLRAHSSRILDPLSRVVKPAAEVRQHMNDVMDRMDRADIEYLAMRLPREKPGRGGTEERTAGEEGHGMRVAKNHNANVTGGTGRNTKVKMNNAAEVETDTGHDGADDDDGEELLEFYDVPSGLVPLG